MSLASLADTRGARPEESRMSDSSGSVDIVAEWRRMTVLAGGEIGGAQTLFHLTFLDKITRDSSLTDFPYIENRLLSILFGSRLALYLPRRSNTPKSLVNIL